MSCRPWTERWKIISSSHGVSFLFTALSLPKLFANYPNIDILNRRQMSVLSHDTPRYTVQSACTCIVSESARSLPIRTGRSFIYSGIRARRGGKCIEYLREGIDYYVDPSLLWICLVRPLSLNNERLVVAYRVRVNGIETVHASTGGTPDLEFDRSHEQFANLLWGSHGTS